MHAEEPEFPGRLLEAEVAHTAERTDWVGPVSVRAQRSRVGGGQWGSPLRRGGRLGLGGSRGAGVGPQESARSRPGRGARGLRPPPGDASLAVFSRRSLKRMKLLRPPGMGGSLGKVSPSVFPLSVPFSHPFLK